MKTWRFLIRKTSHAGYSLRFNHGMLGIGKHCYRLTTHSRIALNSGRIAEESAVRYLSTSRDNYPISPGRVVPWLGQGPAQCNFNSLPGPKPAK
jgi:hypothetical protein